jgi:hypothetical protein
MARPGEYAVFDVAVEHTVKVPGDDLDGCGIEAAQ